MNLLRVLSRYQKLRSSTGLPVNFWYRDSAPRAKRGAPQSWPQKGVVLLISFYRNYISCLMLPRCRFYPSCSAYAHEAIKTKGLMRGLGLALRRLLRCHPFNRTDFFDPVK